MEKFMIQHTPTLQGNVKISGAKNAALPILAACLLTKSPCEIYNVPPLGDLLELMTLLQELGVNIQFDHTQECVRIDASTIHSHCVSQIQGTKLRGSFLVGGALLARLHSAVLPLPGGCPIGTRPIDLHLKGFSAMGATHTISHGMVTLSTKQKLKGTSIYLDVPSVGATENIIIAATMAEGTTTIYNAAAEPEICDLAVFLRAMGANISGEGTDTIQIHGVETLHGAIHRVIPDRIEAGTFMTAVAITGGDICLTDVCIEHLQPVISKLSESNVQIESSKTSLRVARTAKLKPLQVKTMPFPGFPTDMQAQFMSLASVAAGTSIITETIFENRFLHASQLQRMGANIKIENRCAIIEGVKMLTGAKVQATDLRAGAALILSALAARGETEISDISHIERGYYHIEQKLQSLGANIQRTKYL